MITKAKVHYHPLIWHQRLLTPAPEFHGQLGRCGRQLFRADYFSATGRLAWRHVSIWHWWDWLEYWVSAPDRVVRLEDV